MESVLADVSINITELKRNPRAAIAAADGGPVAVLVNSKPWAYLVPADIYRHLLERRKILELAELVHSRATERRIKIKLNEL